LSKESFNIHEEGLKSSITQNTKAIIVNSPHNPTGKVFSIKDFKLISDICIDHDIIAITDEIYEYIIFDGLEHKSIGSFESMYEKTITISGFSKTFSITGWRIGYVVAPKNLMDGVRKIHDYLTVCAPSLLQLAVLNSFNLKPSYFEDLITRYQTNRDYLYEELTKLGMKIYKPEGAYYMFANISEFNMIDTEFANYLVKDNGVAVVPGSSFFNTNNDNKNPGSNFVRFSFSQKLETLKQAIDRIKKKII
ncbi:MAG: pyridoxal phosphate-dependent aminotransferase, partial [Promethearchaeota archaeon]